MPKFDPKIHHRRSIRLKGYDYTQSGAYYVTIVKRGREMLFGDIVDGEMILNELGKIVQWEWQRLAQQFPYLDLGAYQVMPNHFHGTLFFHEVGATRPGITGALSGKAALHNMTPAGNSGSPLPNGPKPASLGAIIGQFKSRVTKRLWKKPSLAQTPIWQRNYYEHIIRNEQDMQRIWRYIESNPSRWADDDENPSNVEQQGRSVIHIKL